MSRDRRQLEWRKAVCGSGVDPVAKYVALVIDTFMDRRGFAWPSHDAIAGRGRVHRRTVIRAVAELEDAGLLLVVHSRGRVSNRYQASIPTVTHESRLRRANSDSQCTPTVTHSVANSDSGVTRSRKEAAKEAVLRRARADARADTDLTRRINSGIDPATFPNPASAQALVAFFVDCCRELGADPPRRLVGQVAQQLGQLTAEGKYDQPTLQQALRLMLERRRGFTNLASYVVEAQAGPPAPRHHSRPEHPADAALRRAGFDPSHLLGGEPR